MVWSRATHSHVRRLEWWQRKSYLDGTQVRQVQPQDWLPMAHEPLPRIISESRFAFYDLMFNVHVQQLSRVLKLRQLFKLNKFTIKTTLFKYSAALGSYEWHLARWYRVLNLRSSIPACLVVVAFDLFLNELLLHCIMRVDTSWLNSNILVNKPIIFSFRPFYQLQYLIC